MKKNYLALFAAAAIILACSCGQQKNKTPDAKISENKLLQKQTVINTADDALNELINGNKRFLSGKMINTDYKDEIEETKAGQHPHSVILSCEDSRVPPEIIFDQGIGNIFVNRVAGNVEDVDMLGSIEYAVKIVGSKLIVVMGHKSCGAIHGAVDNIHLGNLTNLLEEIRPSITGDSLHMEEMLDETTKNNVKMTIDRILKKSKVISDLVNENKVKIVGAYYDVTNGQVIFLK